MDAVPGPANGTSVVDALEETIGEYPESRSQHHHSSYIHPAQQPPSTTPIDPNSEAGDPENVSSADAEKVQYDSRTGPHSNAAYTVLDRYGPAYRGSELHKGIISHDMENMIQVIDGELDLEVEDEYGEKPLYLATRLGLLDAVQLLLQKGASVESRNTKSLEFPTALHQAISSKEQYIARILLGHGANANAGNWNNSTPLAMAVMDQEVEIVDLLLQYGADKEITDRNGMTITALAEGSQQIQSLLREPPLLQGPSTSSEQTTKPTKKPVRKDISAPIHENDKMISLHHFTAVVIDFFFIDGSERRMKQSLSMFDLLYGDEVLRRPPQHGVLRGLSPDFRWYHLPENNMDWVRTLIHQHTSLSFAGFTGLSDDFEHAAGLKGNQDEQHTKRPMSFMRPKCQSFNIGPGGEVSEHQNLQNLVAFMPYLHYENQPRHQAVSENLKQLLDHNIDSNLDAENVPASSLPEAGRLAGDRSHWLPDVQGSLYTHLIKGYLEKRPNDNEINLQLRRTLDQYFFPDTDTIGRDQDQVVYRYTKERYPEPRLFMVDQLWLWVINGNTLITCASNGLEDLVNIHEVERSAAPEQNLDPAPLKSHLYPFRQRHRPKKKVRQWVNEYAQGWQSMTQLQEDIAMQWPNSTSLSLDQHTMNIHQSIIRHLNLPNRASIKSAYELAILVANHCAAVFDPDRTPEEFQFFEFFERSINRSGGEASELRQQLRDAGAHTEDDATHERLHTRREFDLLTETDDIQEELGILRQVLSHEKDVKSKLDAICEKLGHNTQHFVHDGGIMFKDDD